MKRLLYAIVAMAVVISSCSEEKSVKNTSISGRLVGSNVDTVYLERISDRFDNAEPVDAVALADNGAFSFEFNIKEGESPRFYRLTFSEKSRPITLVVAPGDKIEVESVGDVFLNYSVEGSDESALIAEFNHEYFASADKLANIAENIYKGVDNPVVEREAYNIAHTK